MHRLVRMTVFAGLVGGLGVASSTTAASVTVVDLGTFEGGLSPQRQGGGFEPRPRAPVIDEA
jgi:hypothetical protein